MADEEGDDVEVVGFGGLVLLSVGTTDIRSTRGVEDTGGRVVIISVGATDIRPTGGVEVTGGRVVIIVGSLDDNRGEIVGDPTALLQKAGHGLATELTVTQPILSNACTGSVSLAQSVI
jgi:hypothetical protein